MSKRKEKRQQEKMKLLREGYSNVPPISSESYSVVTRRTPTGLVSRTISDMSRTISDTVAAPSDLTLAMIEQSVAQMQRFSPRYPWGWVDTFDETPLPEWAKSTNMVPYQFLAAFVEGALTHRKDKKMKELTKAIRKSLEEVFLDEMIGRSPLLDVRKPPDRQLPPWAKLTDTVKMDDFGEYVRQTRKNNHLVSVLCLPSPKAIENKIKLSKLMGRMAPSLFSPEDGYDYFDDTRNRIPFLTSDSRLNRLARTASTAMELSHNITFAWQKEDEPLHNFREICHAWAFDPYLPRQTLYVSDRPCTLRLDKQERLHCTDGAALAYRDGVSVFAWHGVEIPADFITKPITIGQIYKEKNAELKRILVEIFGPERFIKEADASLVSQDSCGKLWTIVTNPDTFVSWPRRTREQQGQITMVEVVNSTPEPDGSFHTYYLRVPNSMRTARQAIAWTFGLLEHEYCPVAES